ncbi:MULTISPECIES: PIG-L deacetylase family protein [unclassified Streptomyces]|uniref:PIG-L deacetylase family protein n=1 Tax=unclassified Streptomyces TaxID=2593676 RepID=UPI0003C92D54|nr:MULTISPECIES: PIG-L deacetylase family protein [unclassified Streptomyces]AGZ94436.1 lmbe family protein [Streptomyces sp. NRRL B-16215]
MTEQSALEIPERALAVCAHPDDVDFRCAGTLASWARRGTRITLLVLTDGAKGSHDTSLTDAEIRDRRRQEQRAAARVVGYDDVRFLSEPDGLLNAGEETVEQVALVIREVRPQVLLTYDPWAPYILHPDHTEAGRIGFLAAVRAREPRFYREAARRGRNHWSVGELWLFAPFQANRLEDISDTFTTKLQAIMCHESQYETEMGFSPGDEKGRDRFEEQMRAMFAAIGERGGHRYGEEFRRIPL